MRLKCQPQVGLQREIGFRILLMQVITWQLELQLLHRQIAVNDFSLLKQNMISNYLAVTTSMPGLPGSTNLPIPLLRNDQVGHPGENSLPRVPFSIQELVNG